MQLAGVKLRGFRRFEAATNVRLIEQLISLVGPNEAGKTSFLMALRELNKNEEIAALDQTRRVNIETTIEARYLLDDKDYAALSDVPGGDNIKRCNIIKNEDGTFTADLDPAPNHDLAPRRRAREKLEEIQDLPLITNYGSNSTQRKRTRAIKNVQRILGRDTDFLGKGNIDQIQKLASTFQDIVENTGEGDYNKEVAKETAHQLEDLAEHEKHSPPEQARELLLRRQPSYLLFKEEDRELRKSYDLDEVANRPPAALKNLARLAELDLKALRDAAASEDIPHKQDLLEDANEKLESIFSQAWVREEVVPVLSVDGTILHLLVRTPDEEKLSRIDERSDGLRWFVALLAFMSGEDATNQPILLVDEAESHLSYDAQAHLIEVLETQEVAQKVIYTTHSAGCLPSDLGTGIRPVIPLEGERSDIYSRTEVLIYPGRIDCVEC